MFAARRARLIEPLQREGLDAVLITQPINVSYLTGFSGDSSCLVVMPRRSLLISDGRFVDQLDEECPDLETVIRPPIQPLSSATAATINKLGLGNVGFESAHLSVAEFEALKGATSVSWKGDPGRVERIRIIKEAAEVAAIREAIRYAEKGFAAFRAQVNLDDTEKDATDHLEYFMRRAGAQAPAFPSIVAVGPRAALPHAPPTSKRVSEAPLLLIDWGATGAFYKSDLTRVLLTHNNSPFTRSADVDPRIREVYEIVLRAQLAAIAAVRPGAKTKEVDAAARSVIADAGYGSYFTHSIGHGIGLMIHEAPFMRADTEQVLAAGMVVTVEPGIYIPGFAGVRIEDDVLVTPDGQEVLTSVPKTIDDALQRYIEVPLSSSTEGARPPRKNDTASRDKADEAPKTAGPFDVRTVKALVALMTQHDLSEIELRDGNQRLRLRRGVNQVEVASHVPGPIPVVSAADSTSAKKEAPAAPPPAARQLVEIKSPTPGTFYAAAKPGEPPFVKVGAKVTPETVVCLIEAMKLYNEVQAECAGVVVEALVENQQPVEYGQVLFKVDPAG